LRQGKMATIALLMVVVALAFNALPPTWALTRGVYTRIGCYKDSGVRAIDTLEGTSTRLDGNYGTRKDALEKCYHVASKRGYRYFALQNGGQCFSSMNAGQRYNMYGKSNACHLGKGGPWANTVYIINGLYASLGCWKDSGSDRAVLPLEGSVAMLTGNYKLRFMAIQKCYEIASKNGFRYFAIQDGGWCASSANAGTRYKMYGESKACRGGKGGPWANNVYIINGLFSSLGCWADKGNRALPLLEGTSVYLRGGHNEREDPKQTCYKVASERGYRYFSMQDGGQCLAGPDAGTRYDMYGGSNKCRNGNGGPWANDVYVIDGLFSNIGCWKDSNRRKAIQGIDYEIGGNYRTRKSAIQKCYEAAAKKGYKYFAVQNGGFCSSDMRAGMYYRRYGPSRACRGGKGAHLANSVYIINV